MLVFVRQRMLGSAIGAGSRRESVRRRNGASDAHCRNRSRRCSRVRVLLASKQDRLATNQLPRVGTSHRFAPTRPRKSVMSAQSPLHSITVAPRPWMSPSRPVPRTMSIFPAVNAGAAGSCSRAIPSSSPARSPTGGSAPRVDRLSSATRPRPGRTDDEPPARSPRTTHLVGDSWIGRVGIGTRHRCQLCELRKPNQRCNPRHVDVGDAAGRRTAVRPADATVRGVQARCVAQARVASDLVHGLPAVATVRSRARRCSRRRASRVRPFDVGPVEGLLSKKAPPPK